VPPRRLALSLLHELSLAALPRNYLRVGANCSFVFKPLVALVGHLRVDSAVSPCIVWVSLDLVVWLRPPVVPGFGAEEQLEVNRVIAAVYTGSLSLEFVEVACFQTRVVALVDT